MADISTELAAILAAVYGEDVRGSIHDAIKKINDVSEVVLSTGTAITSSSSSSTGFFEDSLYLNTDTYELWKCTGTDTWQSLGILKGDTGPAGSDGSKWYIGTGISGKSVNPTVYSGSGVTNANVDDCFLNNSEGAVYHCTLAGDPTTALWVYDFTMAGGAGSYSAGNGIQISNAGVIAIDPGAIAASETKPVTGDAVNTALADKQNKQLSNQMIVDGHGSDMLETVLGYLNSYKLNLSAADEWLTTSSPVTVSSGEFSFSDINDINNRGYEPWINIDGNSVNKTPYAKLKTISGAGTSNLSLTYETDADNGAVVKLRIIK